MDPESVSLIIIWIQIKGSHINTDPRGSGSETLIWTYNFLEFFLSDPKLAVGKLHALWVDFAKFYEKNQQIKDARIIFEKATHVAYLKVDDLANVWCEWVEMELRSAIDCKQVLASLMSYVGVHLVVFHVISFEISILRTVCLYIYWYHFISVQKTDGTGSASMTDFGTYPCFLIMRRVKKEHIAKYAKTCEI